MSNIMTFAFRLAWAITLTGGLGGATVDMMANADNANRKGLISLVRLNRLLIAKPREKLVSRDLSLRKR